MKKLLFITPELPYPPQSGGKVKSMKLLHALSKRYRVTFVSPLKLDDSKHRDAFEEVSPCDQHLYAPVDVPRNAVNLVASYLQGQPLNVKRTLDRGLQQRVAKAVREYDIVVLDHYEVFPYLPGDYRGLVVYHAHNAYHKMWERYASLPGNPAMRIAARLEATRVKRCESALARRADLVFAAPNDGRELAATGVNPEKIHDTYHLGDDTQLSLPELRFENSKKKLMYVGFLGWEPNVQGLLWFIDKVWPRLLENHPDLSFAIVGKNPDKRLKIAAAPHPGITLTGYVPDLQTIYRESRVSVAPLLFGSGMKVKVLDAMSRGMPTVTTSVGAEGIDAENGRHLLVEDDPARMATRIGELLQDRILWSRLQAASRELIRQQYTWSKLFREMHRTIDQGLKANASRIMISKTSLMPDAC